MRIGIDIRNVGRKRTGDEAVFSNLVRSLAELDRENEYFLFIDQRSEEELDAVAESLGIGNQDNFRLKPLSSGGKFAWNFRTIGQALRREPVDIYLTQYITPLGVPRRTRIATIVHDVSFKAYPELIGKADLFFLNLLIPPSLKRADKVIAVSRFTRDEIIGRYGIAPGKVDWIHNAVPEDYIRRASCVTDRDKRMIRKKYSLPERFVLYIGTLQPRKNLPVLVEAFAKAADRIGPDSKLVLAGGKGHHYDKSIDEVIARLSLSDKVVFAGYVDESDKPALVASACCLCSPSLYEGFGIPVLEGFAAGVPVVASGIPPHEEIGLGAAILFDPHDPDALAEALLSACSNGAERERMRAAGRERVKDFSWDKTAHKMLGIFSEMAEK